MVEYTLKYDKKFYKCLHVCYYQFMELCLFQGTFNPIHNAHLRAAEYLVDNCGIDKIIFIPAFEPPHKSYDTALTAHRYNMVELAIKNNPHFQISDIEYRLKGKSYTYITICELIKEFNPANRIKFIIGTDAFRQIETWYKTEKLKDLVEFLVFKRDLNFDPKEFDRLRDNCYRFKIMPLEFRDISSTGLRNSVKSGKSLKEFVPKEVEDYIRKNELYKDK